MHPQVNKSGKDFQKNGARKYPSAYVCTSSGVNYIPLHPKLNKCQKYFQKCVTSMRELTLCICTPVAVAGTESLASITLVQYYTFGSMRSDPLADHEVCWVSAI